MAKKRTQHSIAHHTPFKLQEVPLSKMVINTKAQRELRPHWVNYLVANFDPNDFGYPVVNWRDGRYYIIDGQHRVEAVKQWIVSDGKTKWEDQRIECRVYQNLSEFEEADMFDRLNDKLTVAAFDRFWVRVTAGREVEQQVAAVVAREKLSITYENVPGAISAVSTLVRIFKRTDDEVLGKTLRIIRDAYGDAGFKALVIDGISHLCQRYNGTLNEEATVAALSAEHGGLGGLLNKAEKMHEKMGAPKARCVAAVAVEIINTRRSSGTHKLTSWWKAEAAAAEAQVAA